MAENLLIQGFIFGLTAGILPGPVMMFSLAEVIKSGSWSGFKVQIGATTMDVFRIVVVFLLFGYIPFNSILVGVISITGGLFLLYMAYRNFIYKADFTESPSSFLSPFWQGVVGNISNASAYIFWFTVGGPIVLQSLRSGAKVGSLLFAVGFLVAITVIGAVIAVLAGRVKTFLSSTYYLYFIRVLGVVLLVFAVLFFRQAYQLLTS